MVSTVDTDCASQDDFSWGNTRMIAGERGKREISCVPAAHCVLMCSPAGRIVHEEGTYDAREIPRRTWQDL